MNPSPPAPASTRLTWLAWMAIPVVLAAGLAWQRRAQRQVLAELASLREQVAQLSEKPAPSAKAESSPDPASARELLALRGELAALRRELAASPRPASGTGPATAAPPPAASPAPVPAYLRKGWVEAEGLPAAVLATLRQQLGEVPIEGAHVKRDDGRLFFGLESKLADGRAIELTLDEQGQVLGRHLEIPLDALDPVVRQQAMSLVGEVPVRRVAEVYEDGQTRYRVIAKDPDGAVNVLLAPDGTVVRTEVERRTRKP